MNLDLQVRTSNGTVDLPSTARRVPAMSVPPVVYPGHVQREIGHGQCRDC
jgi:hypothetical protein